MSHRVGEGGWESPGKPRNWARNVVLNDSLMLYINSFDNSYAIDQVVVQGEELAFRLDKSKDLQTSQPFVKPASRRIHAPDYALTTRLLRTGEVARRVSRLGSNVCLSLASPLLRIGAPSPYATLCGGSSVDPTILRSYPLSCYEPKHDPGALVASDTSLAGAQTTPPKTQKSSPGRKLNVSGGFGVILGIDESPPTRQRRIRRGRCRGDSGRPRGGSGRPRGASGRCRSGGLALARACPRSPWRRAARSLA